MKTLTITLHDTDNCGSSLQAFALQNYLLNHGIENEIIDYVPDYVKNNGSGLKTLLRKLVFYKESKVRDEKFKEFVKKYLHLTKEKYHNFNELCANPPQADCYITGSDQVWNSMYKCGNDRAFYLDFLDSKNKIGYAVSLGREKVPQDNCDIVKKYVRNFKWISVREKSSVIQLQSVLQREDIDYVCDPVLLNPVQVYRDMQAPRLVNDAYILIYMAQIPDTDFMNKFISKVKKIIPGKIVLIGSYRNRCECDIHMRDVAPEDFLSLIANAEYIISNSFHATMFSLIYQKQFATIIPEENGARIKEILCFTDLVHNAISTLSDEVPWVNDYNAVADKLEYFRRKSQNKLLNELGELCDE